MSVGTLTTEVSKAREAAHADRAEKIAAMEEIGGRGVLSWCLLTTHSLISDLPMLQHGSQATIANKRASRPEQNNRCAILSLNSIYQIFNQITVTVIILRTSYNMQIANARRLRRSSSRMKY